MKKYILITFTVLASLLTITSCQDIDLLPKDNLPDPLFWKTPSDYMMEVNQLYSRTESFGNANGTSFSGDRTDLESDLAYGYGRNDKSSGTHSAPNDDGDWNDAYVNLRQANTIIEKSKSYEGEFSEIELYVAEARFFRAYFHWLLMKKYNDVPILTIVLSIESPELFGSREKQEKVEDFILAELEEVSALLPLQSELKSEENGRLTKGAALALKARVALFAGTWAKNHKHRSDHEQLLDQAISAANRVIATNQYGLYEGAGDESYRQLFIDKGDNSSEGIFVSRYYDEIRMHNTASVIAWGDRGAPTKKLAEMYLCKSTGLPISNPNSGFKGYDKIADEYANRDPRMTQTFLMPGTEYHNNEEKNKLTSSPQFTTRPQTRTGYKLWKYMGETMGRVDNATYDYNIIRYAEVLLILAEATFEREGAISNEILKNTINVVRGRKGVEMPPLTNEFVKENGLDMLTEIRRERTIEFAFEGFRRDDLRRWKTAETELKQAVKGIKYIGTEYEELNVLNEGNLGLMDEEGFLIVESAANRKFEAPKHYYNSLPLTQIFLNSNLLPNNPGW